MSLTTQAQGALLGISGSAQVVAQDAHAAFWLNGHSAYATSERIRSALAQFERLEGYIAQLRDALAAQLLAADQARNAAAEGARAGYASVAGDAEEEPYF